jgi:WD40 repeat protein
MRTRLVTVGLCLAFVAGTAQAGSSRPLLIVSVRSGNSDIFLFDPDTGDQKNLTHHPAKDTMPAWWPDGTQIAFSSDRAGGVNLFVMDANGGNVRQLTHEPAGTSCSCATWSPDGKRIAYCRNCKGSETWVIGVDGKGAHRIQEDAWDPAWSPDGTRITFTSLRCGKGFRLHIMDADGGNVRELSATDNIGGSTFPAWSPDGRWIAYTDVADGGAREIFLIAPDGTGRRQLTHLGWVSTFAAWSADGDSLEFIHAEPNFAGYLRISADGTGLGLSPLSSPAFREMPVDGGRPAWKPWPAAGDRSVVRPVAHVEWPADGPRAQVVNRLRGHMGGVSHALISPGAWALASVGDDTRVNVWGPGGARQFLGHTAQVWAAAWSPDGNTLATGSNDKKVRLWDVGQGATRIILDDHNAGVPSVAFTPDGKALVTGALDGSVKVRDAADGKVRYAVELPGRKGEGVAAVAVSPDGRTLVAGGGSWGEPGHGNVAAWDLATGKPCWSETDVPGGVWGLAFAPDGKTLALACLDGTVRLYDPAGGKERQTLKAHGDRALGVAYSPDGKTLATSGFDNTIRLWDAATGRERARLAGHMATVLRVHFHPDGKGLVSSGMDGQVLQWRLEP